MKPIDRPACRGSEQDRRQALVDCCKGRSKKTEADAKGEQRVFTLDFAHVGGAITDRRLNIANTEWKAKVLYPRWQTFAVT